MLLYDKNLVYDQPLHLVDRYRMKTRFTRARMDEYVHVGANRLELEQLDPCMDMIARIPMPGLGSGHFSAQECLFILPACGKAVR